MSDWKTHTIGEIIVDIGDGGTPSRNIPAYFGGNIPWAVIDDIQHEIWNTKESLSKLGLLKSSAKLWPKDAIILSTGATIGEVGIAKVPLATKQGISGIVCGPLVSPEFFYYKLQSLKPYLNSIAQGSTIREVRPPLIKKIEVNIPPIHEQRKIADILSTLDDAIVQIEALVRKYQSVKQGLVQGLLTRGTKKDREQVETPIGLVPKDWELKTIDSISTYVGSGVTPTGGSNVYLTQGILFIRSQNVTFDGLLLGDVVYIDSRTHKNMKRSEIYAHDVLLNITGASIGRCCPFPDGLGKANVNQHVCAIRLPKPNREDAVYLSTILESHIGQSQIEKLNAGGNRQGLNYQQLRSFVVPWAKEKERAEIAEIIESSNATLATERQNLAKLKLLKRGLMQDLLTGQVRV